MSKVLRKVRSWLWLFSVENNVKTIHTTLLYSTFKKCFICHTVCGDLIRRAKDSELKVKGPVRMPTKVLKITTRKTPCGEGSKTWDRFEMKIYKRVIDLHSAAETVKQIVSLSTSLKS